MLLLPGAELVNARFLLLSLKTTKSFQEMSHWFPRGSMHNCTATIQEEASHVAKIIHFHGPEKAFGFQRTFEKKVLVALDFCLC